MQAPINIFSGEVGLGGALTNPTELARRKGHISVQYSVLFQGRQWPDIELAYHVLAQDNADADSRDILMHELIAAKFRQHPALYAQVAERGGAAWLETCSHWTKSRSEGGQKWEGAGLDSRFIRNLVSGYVLSNEEPPAEKGQASLF